MKFKFRFDSVLKIRRYQKRKEKQKLNVLFNKRSTTEQLVSNLWKQCRQEAESSTKESVLANRRYYTQKHRQHEYLKQLKQELNQLNSKVKQQREKLAEAVKRMQMMEKIKERDKKVFIEHAEHVEQLQQNEVAIQRYNSDFEMDAKKPEYGQVG